MNWNNLGPLYTVGDVIFKTLYIRSAIDMLIWGDYSLVKCSLIALFSSLLGLFPLYSPTRMFVLASEKYLCSCRIHKCVTFDIVYWYIYTHFVHNPDKKLFSSVTCYNVQFSLSPKEASIFIRKLNLCHSTNFLKLLVWGRPHLKSG